MRIKSDCIPIEQTMMENPAIALECQFTNCYPFDVTNNLVVVVRIFGGVKLGVGGLIAS
jgi:hypothetical protein